MTTKTVSRTNFLVGHIVVVVVYALVALMLIRTQYTKNAFGYDNRSVILGLSIFLLLSNLLALVPMLMSDRYVVE
jgi:membrane glycosyltransferase